MLMETLQTRAGMNGAWTPREVNAWFDDQSGSSPQTGDEDAAITTAGQERAGDLVITGGRQSTGAQRNSGNRQTIRDQETETTEDQHRFADHSRIAEGVLPQSKPSERMRPREELAEVTGLEVSRGTAVLGARAGWIWESVIPRGAMTLLTGESAIGKSFLMLDVAARVTRGQHGLQDLPRGLSANVPPGEVLLLAEANDLEDMIRPRLFAAGADLARVHIVTGIRRRDEGAVAKDVGRDGEVSPRRSSRPELDRDLSLIEDQLRRLQQQGLDVQLVIIDPIRCFTGFGNQSVVQREVTAMELAGLAQRWNVAVVAISEDSSVSTANGRLKPINAALAERARAVWNVTRDPADPDRRLLLAVKTSLCATPPGRAFAIQGGAVAWEPAPVLFSAAQFAARVKAQKRGGADPDLAERELTWAFVWLAMQLADGPVPVATLRKDARDCNVTTAMLHRAFFQLNCQVKQEYGNRAWNWALPTGQPSPAGFSCASQAGLRVDTRSRVEGDLEDVRSRFEDDVGDPRADQGAEPVQEAEDLECDVRAESAPAVARSPVKAEVPVAQPLAASFGCRGDCDRQSADLRDGENDDFEDEDESGADEFRQVLVKRTADKSGLTPERRAILRKQRKLRRKQQRRHR
jgi:hypothetical protein